MRSGGNEDVSRLRAAGMLPIENIVGRATRRYRAGQAHAFQNRPISRNKRVTVPGEWGDRQEQVHAGADASGEWNRPAR
jgi:hypothetical protein